MTDYKVPKQVTINAAWVRKQAGEALTSFFAPASAVMNVAHKAASGAPQSARNSAPMDKQAGERRQG